MLKRTSKNQASTPHPIPIFPHAEKVYEQKESNFIKAAL
jgi:hypothetical protein